MRDVSGSPLWRRRLWHLRHEGIGGLREFERRHRASERGPWGRVPVAGPTRTLLGRPGGDHPFVEWPLPDRETWRGRRDLTVGIIADDFTSLALSYEWRQIALYPRTWRDQVAEHPLDLLFMESAWHGNGDAWQYQLTGPHAPSSSVVELVAWCRAAGVPTVFWNKEDPVHFEDFLDTARLFDHVFTTEGDLIPDYVAALGHDRVGLLPFAAQPAIHNPIRPGGWSADGLRDVAFAGTYFRDKYPERRAQMDVLLGGALDADRWLNAGLEIFSRFQQVDERYAFPPPYDMRVVGELSYEEMLTANRCYRVFLNVNSIPDSQTMCARRIFEVTACGTPVLSAPSPAIDTYFPAGQVLQAERREQATQWIRALAGSAELRDRITHLAQRTIWQSHTYGHRVDTVLEAAGLEDRCRPERTVTAMVSTNRPHQLRHVLDQLAGQQDVAMEVRILTHGFHPDDGITGYARERGLDVEWMTADADLTLGECYNRLIACSSSDALAKIDDDDLYGPHYLFDQLKALEYAGADVVGKGAHYVHLDGANALCLRFPDKELTFSHFVAGPTIMAWGDVMRDVPFSARTYGEDSEFLREVSTRGGSIFSSDRYGYVQQRSDPSHHTWSISEGDILATSRLVVFGEAPNHVLI